LQFILQLVKNAFISGVLGYREIGIQENGYRNNGYRSRGIKEFKGRDTEIVDTEVEVFRNSRAVIQK